MLAPSMSFLLFRVSPSLYSLMHLDKQSITVLISATPGYTFSHLFGSIYDAKTPSTPSPPEQDNVSSPALLSRALRQLLGRAGDVTGHVHICPLGRECYSQIFAYTIPACILAFILSIVLSLRRGRGLENSGKDRHQALDEEEFLAEVEH